MRKIKVINPSWTVDDEGAVHGDTADQLTSSDPLAAAIFRYSNWSGDRSVEAEHAD
jgi:hypothetical protein